MLQVLTCTYRFRRQSFKKSGNVGRWKNRHSDGVPRKHLPLANRRVLVDLIQKRGLEQKYFVDSCATGAYHIGKKADPRALNTMQRHHILVDHRARLLDKEDFTRFKYIFGMDHANIEDINDEKPSGSTAIIGLLGEHDPEGQVIIRDPYYDHGEKGFETCYEQCVRACTAFLDKLESQ